jgi:hypothetical protein
MAEFLAELVSRRGYKSPAAVRPARRGCDAGVGDMMPQRSDPDAELVMAASLSIAE